MNKRPWLSDITSFVIALAIFAFIAFWLGGFHIVRKPTAAQLFGCKETYINDKGEDTGECR